MPQPLLPEGPQADDLYHVYALCFARIPERRIHENFMRRDMHDGSMPLDFNVWIVRNAHRTILVDTGFGPRAADERSRPLDIDPLVALQRLGLAPESLEDIILSHLHYDHAGNLDRFGQARFHVQDAEVAYATGRCMCHEAMRYPFDVEDVVHLVRCTFAERVRHHDGPATPFPGISLHPLPGHSRGLQGVRVNTARGPILLASDASHYFANLLRRAPFAITIDTAATLDTYATMLELVGSVEHIIPGHDPRVRDLYPSLTVAGIELLALHEVPRAHDPETLRAL